MEIKIIELSPNKALIRFLGEGHTFMNVLADEILKDPEVEVARYHLEFHFSDPELIVTTSGSRQPMQAIMDACRRISGYCDTLLDQVAGA
jgi:DNA-directed RNA polymerase subunit L